MANKQEKDLGIDLKKNVHSDKYYQVEGMTMPKSFEEKRQEILKFPVYDDDVWICSFPKTGTTWTQEMVWMIMNNLDFTKAKETNLDTRSPFFEDSVLSNYQKIMENYPEFKLEPYQIDSLDYVKHLEHPACIKTHLPFHLLPKEIQDSVKKPKIIYVMRNPRDTCVSLYYHIKLFDGYKGNLEEFCDVFLASKVSCTPFWKHILPFWDRRSMPNLLIIKYEDMKKDLRSVIEKVCEFLKNPLTELQIESLAEHLSFENMKKNPSVNFEATINLRKRLKIIAPEIEGSFMRKGIVGSYKDEMSAKTIAKFDRWIEENLRHSDLQF